MEKAVTGDDAIPPGFVSNSRKDSTIPGVTAKVFEVQVTGIFVPTVLERVPVVQDIEEAVLALMPVPDHNVNVAVPGATVPVSVMIATAVILPMLQALGTIMALVPRVELPLPLLSPTVPGR